MAMVTHARAMLFALLCTHCAAWHVRAPLPRTLGCAIRTSNIVAQERRLTRQEEQDRKAAIQASLDAANNKLEEINEVQKAPTSWADMGLPKEPERAPEVPFFVSIAPLVVGGFSVLLFLLNAVGVFGDGPDLDALVEEWSNL